MTGPVRRRQAYRQRVVLMVKVPGVGRVKTRLAREIGAVWATAFYRQTAAAVLARVGAARDWDTLLAVAPDAQRTTFIWPRRFARLPQGGGDLGCRLQRVMDRLPAGPVLIVGTDIPGIRARHVREAFRMLGAHDAVLGPAPDGGFWLVGLRRLARVPRVFENVRWSGPHALSDTLSNLDGRKVALAATLADVDSAQDLTLFARAYGRRVLPASLP